MYVCMYVCQQSGQWVYLYMTPIQGNFHYKLINRDRDPSALSILCVCVYFNHNLILASGRYYMYLLLIISRLQSSWAVSQVISRKTLCEKWIFSFLLLLLLLQPHQRHRTPAEVLTRGNNTLIKLPDKAQVEHIFFCVYRVNSFECH